MMSNVIEFPGRFNDWTVAERQLMDLIRMIMDRNWGKGDLSMTFVDALANPDMQCSDLRTITEAILALNHQGLPTDVVTVSGYLNEYGLLDEVGGLRFLSKIIMAEA